MATHADEGNSLPQLTPRELQTRKAFVGLDVAATRALQAIRPWMEAHVHEVVEEFYAHLLRFQQPRWLLADPQRLAHVKAAQTDSLLSFTRGNYDMAYVASRHTIGRTHARVGVTPQWYLGAFSIFARILFPKILAYYHDRPLTGMAAVKALIAVMHLDMQLAIDAYLEASQETLQQNATDLEDAGRSPRRAPWRSVPASSKPSIWSAPPPVGSWTWSKVWASTLPLIVDIVGAAGAEVHLADDDGCLTWTASHGLPDRFCRGLEGAAPATRRRTHRASVGHPDTGAGGRSPPRASVPPPCAGPCQRL